MCSTAMMARNTKRCISEETSSVSLQHSTNAESCEPRWYAAYTSANHEKRIAEQLRLRSVEHFLPLYESLRRWKDRKVNLYLPLFPGYVFVRIALRDRFVVQQIPGVARLVGFGGMPAALPEDEMQTLRASLERGVRAEPHPFLTVGRPVRVKNGPMAGLQGILKRRKSQARLVVSLELIQRAMAVEIDEADLETMT
jgi:transcription antitermination factor NusG